jgi:hypothetical protein
MAARARYSRTPPIDDYGPYEEYGPGDLLPGERLGPPVPRAGLRTLLWSFIVLSLALAGAWAVINQRLTLPDWLLAEIGAAGRSLDARQDNRLAPPSRVATFPAADPAPARKSTVFAAPAVVPPPAAIVTPEAERRAPASAPPEATVPESEEPADPYQARAAAVGLHPGLSRVLLARLSPADYRNAGIAINTALRETPDSGTFVWPRQRSPELALFHVRFVPGAAPGCRRYVVTITKDRWSTTALPVEKCGSEVREARRK